MHLRPHHLMCIQKFTGHGYDRAFTEHMTALVLDLRRRPGTEITLTPGPDILCGACPNLGVNGCSSLEKVEDMDLAVLSACGLKPGGRGSWAELSGLARDKIFRTEKFDSICRNCQWFQLCKDTPQP